MSKLGEVWTRERSIVFQSKRFPIFGVETFVTPDGRVKKRNVHVSKLKLQDKLEGQKARRKSLFKLRVVCFDIALITMSAIFMGYSSIVASIVFSLFASFSFFNILEGFVKYKVFRNKEEVNRYGLHAAEHMVVNAYNELLRVPTLQETEQFSRFSNNCGTSEGLKNLAFYLAYSANIFILSEVSFDVLIAITISLILMWYFLINKRFGKYLQIVVTAKPTKQELHLAIMALNNFLELEKSIAENAYSNVENIKKFFETQDSPCD